MSHGQACGRAPECLCRFAPQSASRNECSNRFVQLCLLNAYGILCIAGRWPNTGNNQPFVRTFMNVFKPCQAINSQLTLSAAPDSNADLTVDLALSVLQQPQQAGSLHCCKFVSLLWKLLLPFQWVSNIFKVGIANSFSLEQVFS